MADREKILVVASASMDMLLRVKRIPKQGEMVEENVCKYVPGGVGVNTSLFLKRFGYEPVLCAKVGADANGKWLTESLRKNGLDTRLIHMASGVATGMSVIVEPENEANRTIYLSNANNKLRSDDIADATMCYPNAVFAQMTVPSEAFESAVDYAQRKKLPLIITTGTSPKKYDISRIGSCTLFITNQDMVTFFTGITDFKYDSMVKVGVCLSKYFHADNYVIKLNNGNTLIYNQVSVKLHTPTIPGQFSYDPTTAFDAFAAAVTCEYLRTEDIERASRFAGIIESMAKLGEGSSKSIPKDMNEVRTFITDNNIQYDL